MCAIIDANSLPEVFGDNKTDRSMAFVNWLEAQTVQVVIGGTQYRAEVDKVAKASQWFRQAIRTGRASEVNDEDVDRSATDLRNLSDARHQAIVRSDDPHILALARCSGARLLYTADGALIQDFTDANIIGRPVGKVLPPSDYHEFLNDRRNRRLCSQ